MEQVVVGDRRNMTAAAAVADMSTTADWKQNTVLLA